MTVAELIPVLQMAIGPVVLISGVGLLFLSLTNRMGRIIDRGRILAADLRQPGASVHPHIETQLKILSRRAHLMQRAIFFAVLCVLLAAVLIMALFFIALLKIEAVWLIGGLFMGSLLSLIVSLVTFMQELTQALIVFHLEIEK